VSEQTINEIAQEAAERAIEQFERAAQQAIIDAVAQGAPPPETWPAALRALLAENIHRHKVALQAYAQSMVEAITSGNPLAVLAAEEQLKLAGAIITNISTAKVIKEAEERRQCDI
jgi:type II secretory pathway pseudopilin PulG